MRRRVFGIEGDRLAIGGLCLLHTVEVLQHIAEIGVCCRMRGVECDRAAEARFRLLQRAGFAERVAEV